MLSLIDCRDKIELSERPDAYHPKKPVRTMAPAA
jgi:hypothetical protein